MGLIQITNVWMKRSRKSKDITKRRECHDCIKMRKVGRENKRNDHSIQIQKGEQQDRRKRM